MEDTSEQLGYEQSITLLIMGSKSAPRTLDCSETASRLPFAATPVQVVGTEVQAVYLSPYTPTSVVEDLGIVTASRLFPPCYTPSPLSGFKPSLAEMRWVCTGCP